MDDKRRGAHRKAVGLQVTLRYDTIESFEEAFATNLSEGGMFIRARNPKPPGTLLRFEVVLAEGKRLMHGTAAVRWVRAPDDPAGAPGMGVEFVQLGEKAAGLIRQILERRSSKTLAPAPEIPAVAPLDPTLSLPPPAPPDAVDVDVSHLIATGGNALVEHASAEAAPAPLPEFELDIEVEEPPEAIRPPQMSGIFLQPKGEPASTGPVIGIDLGTTNSCVAFVRDGRPEVLATRTGEATLPSVVSLTSSNRLLVGQRAREQLMLNPANTIYGSKRLVGRRFDAPVVSAVRGRFHYEVRPDADGAAAVRMGSETVRLDEVQGLILKECREIAEHRLGQTVERAVITVPAYYSEPQREAVRRAARLAGLRAERILNEPTAAALAYGLNRGLNRKVLIYDLGGGTFDATLLRVENNVFEVLATGGDVFLGGVDFDNSLVDLLIERFQQQENVLFAGDDAVIARLRDAAERIKVTLSGQLGADVHLPMLMVDTEGKPRDLRVHVRRAELDRVAEPLVLKTLDVVRDVLLDANVKARDVDEIILVGGQSRMPLIRERLREMFGRPPHAGVNADEAVAIGAALMAATVDKVSSVVLVDVLPMTVGVGLPGGGFKRVIERNTPLPTSKTFTLPTTRDGQRALGLSLFQGEEAHVERNEYLGTVRIDGLPSAPRGVVKVAVTVRVDADCIIHVEARELRTHRRVSATFGTRYTPEQIRSSLGLPPPGAAPERDARAQELEARAGRFWGMLRKMLGRA